MGALSSSTIGGPASARDAARPSFLLVVGTLFVVLLVLLSGCVASPTRLPYRNGDFVSHIATSKDQAPPQAQQVSEPKVAVPSRSTLPAA